MWLKKLVAGVLTVFAVMITVFILIALVNY